MQDNILQAFLIYFLHLLRDFTILGITIIVLLSFGTPLLKFSFGISFGFTLLLRIFCIVFVIISEIGINKIKTSNILNNIFLLLLKVKKPNPHESKVLSIKIL